MLSLLFRIRLDIISPYFRTIEVNIYIMLCMKLITMVMFEQQRLRLQDPGLL